MKHFKRFIACGLVVAGLAGCSDLSEITTEDEARFPETTLQPGGSAPQSGQSALAVAKAPPPGLNQQGLIDGCTPGRLCTAPRPQQVVTTGPDASGYFETGRAQAANMQAQGRVANQRILLNNGRPETIPGQRARLTNEQTGLRQQELRLQRDRLRTAPFGQTIGSIYAQ